ncbi:Bgt-20796 [Blumeria graminis f. sp. tritici]|uniref:Bgt-20796 n=1 Tax=Blumeria graminis f. sp. tritici TaxID=62690 RepID=A0A9X9L9K9_BLUGR|nr:Bgt-20796 [Blumeria graminis f. sp. tritici]
MIKSINLPVDGPVDGEDINVLGEINKSPSGNVRQEKFIRLSRSVRQVFCAQPLRRFIHGFCLFQEEFELWLFDRSGAYGSGLLSIVDDKEIFIRAISSYLLMSDEELGRDMSILQKGEDKFVQFRKSGNIEGSSYEIKSKPLVQAMGLFDRSITSYETKDESTVIKYSWISSEKDT